MDDLANAGGAGSLADAATAFRLRVRAGGWTRPTANVVNGALQANLAVVPAAHAADLAAFCRLNARPCPLLAQSAPGDPRLPTLGADLSVATDLPAYRVIRDGAPAERVGDLTALWQDDWTAFAIGCSFSFELAMLEAGLPLRHHTGGRNVPMYVTDRQTVASGPFGGPMVVSMRPLPPQAVETVAALCARFPFAHGAPVHVGDPAALGIADLGAPDFGDPPAGEPGDVPAFWACGVTLQMALRNARLPLCITHEPGHMLVTDRDAAAPGLEAWRAA